MCAEWKSIVKEWGSPQSGPAVSGVPGKKGLRDAFAPSALGKFMGRGRKDIVLEAFAHHQTTG